MTLASAYVLCNLSVIWSQFLMEGRSPKWSEYWLVCYDWILEMSYTSPPVWKTTSLQWCHLWTIQARLPRRPPFSQYVLWWCCNPLGILSSMVEILLFNSVFHDGVAPISVSTLKPPLGVIGVLPLKPQASPIISVVYKTSSYIVIH